MELGQGSCDMARSTGPKNRLARRTGQDLGLKSNPMKVARRINILPGQHGRRGRRKSSEYGEQLAEKQKVKYIYGLLEKQFHKLYVLAAKTPASTGKVLLSLLERRLDNVVFRLGIVPTRTAARQLGDVVSISDKAMKIPYIADLLKEKDKTVPKWLEKKAVAGKVLRFPERDEIDAGIQEQRIVEFYSR